MRFAHNVLKATGALLLIMALVLSVQAWALADDNDPVNFTIQVTPESMTGPGEATVSLRVSNPTNTDMVAPVTLYDPTGTIVSSFGDNGSYTFKSGDSLSWEGKWNVTQAQLDEGGITFTLRYHLEDENGELVEMTRQAVGRISFIGEKVNLVVNRTIDPQVVRSGGTASVVYELYNSGNVELTNIRIQENVSKTAKTVNSLPAGERTTVTFTPHIGNADLTSNASITYKAAGSSKTLTEKVEDAIIPLAKPNLKIELSAPEGGVNIGEAVTLNISFINSGNVSYSNVTVTEAKKGEIANNLSIPAGATVNVQKEFILMEPTDFKVTATLPDNTGETRTLSSNEIKVGVFDPEKQLLLTLNLTSDQETVAQVPADVKFHLTVTNNSNVKAEKIAITHGATAIYTIASLEPGASMVLDRDVRISQAGQFRFTASVKDSLSNTVTFDSNTIRISFAQPTSAPTAIAIVTVAPPVLVTPVPSDPLLSQGRNALMTAAVVMGALFAGALILFAVSTVVRVNNKRKSNAAYDHLDLAERRDYTEPADESEAEEVYDATDSGEEVSLPAQEEKAEALPHEKLLQNAQLDQDDAPVQEEMPPVDSEGGYRVSRAAQISPAPAEQPPAPEAPAEAQDAVSSAPETSRRRKRRASRAEDGE